MLGVHPIERLRFVARASGQPQATLVQETAGALSALGFDGAGLVTACRRIIDRHPNSGALWWLSARVLTADDAGVAAWRCVDEIRADRTAGELAQALPEGATVLVVGAGELSGGALARRGDVQALAVDPFDDGGGMARRLHRADVDVVEVPGWGLGAAAAAADVVVLEASALGATGFVAVAGSRAAAAVAADAGVPVWVVAGVGRVLPGPTWGVLTGRLEGDPEPWESEDEVVPIELVSTVVGPRGPGSVADALAGCDSPVAPELFRSVDPL
jgi:hypothetical protein